MLVGHHNGTVPVHSDESPRQRAGDCRDVDEARVDIVAEVERREIEEVDDEDDLGPDEVAGDEQEHKGGVQQVVEDEVATNSASGVDGLDLGREEVGDVASLEDEENNPVWAAD